MNRRDALFASVGALFVAGLGLSTAFGGNVAIPNTFVNGSVADADDVNANFTAVADEVNDNDARISALEGAPTTAIRSLTVPAAALAYTPTSTVISDDTSGLIWTQDFGSSATLRIAKPVDYAGGDVDFKLLFQTTAATAGVVNFFVRPRSFNAGQAVTDAPSTSSGGVTVGGSAFAIYEDVIPCAASTLTNDFWVFNMQREGSNSTYTNSVILNSVTIDYEANR